MPQLSGIFEMPNKIEEFLRFYNEHDKLPVFLWGGGAACGYFMEFMRRHSITISGIIDKQKSAQIKDGMKLLMPAEVYGEYENVIVVISAIAHRDAIMEEIRSKKSDYFVFCFDPTLEILQRKSPEERRFYFTAHKNELNDFNDILADEQSKIVFKNVVKGAITANPDCYRFSSSTPQYFPEIIKENMTEEEIFVDLGAYDGDSIKEFMDVTDGKFKKIYAFEPDPSNMCAAKAGLCDARIEFYQNGVGSEAGVFYLVGTEEAARCEETGNENAVKVEIVKLDDVISTGISYLKLDIEGMELDALKGAERLIREYKPKLAVSVYHKMEDMVEIPNYIKGLNLGYRFYLRHLWNCNGTDVVLFAI